MSYAQALLNELRQEAAVARLHLAQVSFEHADFRPHEKSEAFGRLAVHIADLLGWWKYTLKSDGIDVAGYKANPIQSTEALLAHFDALFADAVQTLENAQDGDFEGDWTLRYGQITIFCLPRKQVIRTFCLNHLVHHRAQLGVYLRLLGRPVPATYGPSADDKSPILTQPY